MFVVVGSRKTAKNGKQRQPQQNQLEDDTGTRARLAIRLRNPADFNRATSVGCSLTLTDVLVRDPLAVLRACLSL
jgi:hypothetical protein